MDRSGRISRGRRSLLTALVLAGVVAVAATATVLGTSRSGTVDPTAGSESPAPARVVSGPHVPPQRALSGELTFVEPEGCRFATLDYASLQLDLEAPGSADPCEGQEAPRATGIDPTELDLGLEGLEAGLRSRSGRPITVLGWGERDDGLRAVAVQREAPRSVAAVRTEIPEETASAARYAWSIRASHGGSLPDRVLQLWREGSLEGSLRLPTRELPGETALGEVVSFSPNGSEVALSAPGLDGWLVVVEIAGGRTLLGPIRQSGHAWSPDGLWLAIAGEHEVSVYGHGRLEPAYALPLRAASLEWR